MNIKADISPYCLSKIEDPKAHFLDNESNISGIIKLNIREIKENSLILEIELIEDGTNISLAKFGQLKISKPASMIIEGITAKVKVLRD